jgi:lipid II:glycine glycyltransferase (peptidoglycan interpeptide bridge formation enzyme)
MGGPVADGPLTEADLAAVARDLAALQSLATTITPNPLHAELWAAATTGLAATPIPRRAHVLDIEGGKDDVWTSRFASSARRAVRKAERAGLEIECGSDERQLAAFGDLFDRSIERWARSQHEPPMLARLRARRRDPPRKFRSIAAAIGPSLRVWVARRDGTPVAAIVVLLGADAHYTRGAMDKELIGPTAANELLHWLAIGEACEAGCRRYHMGETGDSRPLARFKEKLGAQPVPYAEYRFERLPFTRSNAAVRGLVKRALRFKDA